MSVTNAPGAAFWQAALKLYAKPGAQAALLEIQEKYGGDVMAFLWAAVAGFDYRKIDDADCQLLDTLTQIARQEAAARRALRRQIKNSGGETSYAVAKSQELIAERAVASAAPDPTTIGLLQRTRSQESIISENLAEMAKTLNPVVPQQYIENLRKILTFHP